MLLVCYNVIKVRVSFLKAYAEWIVPEILKWR